MLHFYLPPDRCKLPGLILTGGEAHHARKVMRVRPGQQVSVLNGAGTIFVSEVHSLKSDEVHLRVIEERQISPLPWQITLIQALPKGKLVESIIQKATELGVCRIVPLVSERVVTHLDDESSEGKIAKWQTVAIEAIKQCGSAWLPRVDPPIELSEFLARKEHFALKLVGSLQPGSEHPRRSFNRYEDQFGRAPRTVSVWIGPEGDFSPEETSSILASGAAPITLGRLVLRTETAAIYCLSVINYELSSRERAAIDAEKRSAPLARKG